MTWKDYLLCGLISTAVMIAAATFQTVPGYMDAEYYYGMGLRIAKYGQLTEPFIWNYLGGARTIPHPGFMYWMPFPALVSAAGMVITGWYSFAGARIGSMVLAVIMPAITMNISFQLTGKRRTAYLAGWLAIFPVFYNTFLTTTDSFAITMMLGGGFVLLALRDKRGPVGNLGLGIIAGLMHLTRADGMIWAAAALLLSWKQARGKAISVGAVLAGYLLVMGPWFVRNYGAAGSLMPAGTAKMFWLTEYNELFTYQIEKLNYQSWRNQGISAILLDISTAVRANLKTMFIVQGSVVLFPLTLLGLYKKRSEQAVQAAIFVWGSVFVLMGVVFPFAGMRGGYLHSSAALQPLIWALAAVGFQELVAWAAKVRDWQEGKAFRLFGAGLGLIIALTSVYVYQDRVIGGSLADPVWDDSYQAARQIGQSLSEYHSPGLVMINNPPGYYAATGDGSVVIPNGAVDDLLRAASDLGVRYVIIEPNHPEGLNQVYSQPDQQTGLFYRESVGEAHIFEIPAQ